MSRALPNAVEAEKALLCALLNSPQSTLNACDSHAVTDASLYLGSHSEVFRAVRALFDAGRAIDFVTVGQALHDSGKLDAVGGAPALSSLFTFTATFANLGDYLDEIAEKHTRRQLYVACMNSAQDALNTDKPIHATLNELATNAAQFAAGGKLADLETIKDPVMRKLNRMSNGEPEADVIRTGIDGLDRHSPMNRGDMPIISGERKAGKSILALTILAHIGLELSLPVAYFSLEDRINSVIDRLMASVARVPCWKHHAKFVDGISHTNLNSAAVRLGNSRIYAWDDTYDLHAIVAKIKRLKTKEPNLAAAVVDYAQLVRAREGKNDSREQEVARISRTLRLLAMELRICIVLLCQLNTEGETRESKAIEMDTTAMWKVCNGKEKGQKLIAIPFQRNGVSGVAFPVTFMGEICRFENMAKTEIEDYDAPTKPKSKGKNH